MTGRRWDGDERGEGIGDAVAFVPGAEALVETMRQPSWVAESPELHLLPHIESACESLPLRVVGSSVGDDASFDVELRWTGEPRRQADVRAAVYAVLGGFAELSTYVRQSRGAEDGMVVFEVVTGILDGESRWSPHGHTLRLTVSGILPRSAG